MTMTSFDYEQINCTYSYQHLTITILLANLYTYIYLLAFAALRFIKKLQLRSVLHNHSPFSSKYSQDNMYSKVDGHTLTTWHTEA